MLKYKLKRMPKKKLVIWSTMILLFIISMGSIVGYYAAGEGNVFGSPIISGDTVFVDDLTTDWNYYMGLNYTEITNKNTLPGMNATNTAALSSNKYNQNTLVAVQINYDGTDINDNITGHVSYTEQQSKYVYRKYVPIVDGKITIELIDNPFTQRPTGKGFNGWVCDDSLSTTEFCSTLTFSYDDDKYIRYVTLPAPTDVDENGFKKVTINLKTSWIDARITSDEDEIDSIFEPKKMVEIGSPIYGQVPVYRTVPAFKDDVDYLEYKTVSRGGSTRECVNYNRNTCGARTCDCYYLTDDSAYNSNTHYYIEYTYWGTTYYRDAEEDDFGKVKAIPEEIIGYEEGIVEYRPDFDNNDSLTGYYYLTTYDSSKAELFYNEYGIQCSLSGSNCSGEAYKLIQYNDDPLIKTWTVVSEVQEDGTTIDVVQNDYAGKYFYFSTRDTNIFDLSGTNTNFSVTTFDDYSYPMTVTGSHDGDYSAESITSGSLSIREDMVLENLEFTGVDIYRNESNDNLTTTNAAVANYKNFKISRTVSQDESSSMTFYGVHAAGDSDSSDKSSKTIVEAGYYNFLQSQRKGGADDENVILQAGNDYDRVSGNNENLKVYFQMIASTNGNHNSTSINPTSLLVVKSGIIGSGLLTSNNYADYYTYYYMFGIYVGARANTASSTSLRSLKIEGGHIFSINGGPCIQTGYSGNVISIYMTGGVVDNIVGGAGSTESYGNRLISISGGTVTNSVAGGSNSYEGSADEGTIEGNTLVYVGGNAHIGGGPTKTENQSTSTLMGVNIPGSIFGAGLGFDAQYSNGIVTNSHVIVDGSAEIEGSVFGGGNFGSVVSVTRTNRGISYVAEDTAAVVDILGGTVYGSVFGSANNNGAGYNNGNTSYTNIVPNVTYVLGKAYWLYGETTRYNQNIPAGSHFVNGGYVSTNTPCTTSTSGYLRRDGNRYSGYYNVCAYYTQQEVGGNYNANNHYYDFDYNSNIFYEVTNPLLNAVNVSAPPSITVNEVDFYHDITVNMHGGNVVGSVYGGSNASGVSYADVTINLYKGKVESENNGVYGGGKGISTVVGGDTIINTLPNNDDDLKINEIYGGSELGRVNPNGHTEVNVNGGLINTVYGGGKGSASGSMAPYTFGTISVDVKDGVVDKVFGGNNEFGNVDSRIDVKINGATINSVYGGSNGEGASAVNTNVVVNKGRIKKYVYGGGAYANTTGTTNVTINGGDFVYYNTDNTVDMSTAPALVFGGGESANVGSSLVYIENGATLYSVYGGSNFQGTTNKTKVYANAGKVLCNAYGGGSEAPVNNSNIYLLGTEFTYKVDSSVTDAYFKNTCGNAFGGGASANVENSLIALNGSSLANVYGGSDQNGEVGTSNVVIKKGNVVNVFGGNNAGGTTENTNVTVDLAAEVVDGNETIIEGTASLSEQLSIENVFGGANGSGASVTGNTFTELKSGTITYDIFGGGNQAKVVSGTTVNMYDGSVRHLYGGGNRAFIGEAIVAESGDLIEGIEHAETHVNVVGGTIRGNIYGSGNASFVYGNTYIKIGNAAFETLGIQNGNRLYTNLSIGGSVFAGSETNTDKSTTYDEKYEGVAGDATHGKGLIEIDGLNYISGDRNNLTIGSSVYGSGNNSKVVNGSTIYIDNIGTEEHPMMMTTIQRANNVYLTDTYIELNGDRDRADPDSYKYSLIRLEGIYLLGSSADKGSHLYLRKSTSFLKSHYSGTMTTNASGEKVFTPQTVSEVGGVLTPAVSNNKIFMYKRYIYTVASANAPSYDADTTSAGPVTGMTYLGMYSSDLNSNVYQKGIYDDSYDQGGTYNSEVTGSFENSDYTFVYGLHPDDPDKNDEEEAEYQIKNNGFYTHVQGIDTAPDGTETKNNTITVEYVGVTPLDTTYYKWVIGEEPAEIIVDLIADKYSESGTVNALITLDELKDVLEDGTKQEWRDAVLTIKSVETDSFGVVKGSESTENIKGYLVDKSRVPTINTNDGDDIVDPDGIIDANQYFALSMGTTSAGWLDNYKTNFYDEEFVIGEDFCAEDAPGGCTGDQIYLYDSTTKQRSLSFWLYHSKNLDFQYIVQEEGSTDVNMLLPMGSVVINAEVYNPHGDQSTVDVTQSVIITVNISLSDGELDKYGGIIAPGKHYEVFQGKSTTIPTDGAFSIYQSLSLDLTGTIAGSATNEPWGVEKLYNEAHDSVLVKDAYGNDKYVSWGEAYRYLNSDIILPVGTKISMLDLKNNEQYYYEVTAENRQQMINKHSGTNNEYRYLLEDFVKMGSISSNNLYNDDMKEGDSTKYYFKKTVEENGEEKVISEMAVEEFIFSVDFSGVDAADSSVLKGTHYLFLELGRTENGINDTVISTNGMPKEEMIYTVVSDVNSSVSTTGGYVQEDGSLSESTTIYVGESAKLELNTKLSQTDANNNSLAGVSDTIFDEYKLGAKITIQRAKMDEDGNIELDADGNVIYNTLTTDLFGTVMTINNVEYFPQTDGSTRIELAGRITDVKSLIDIDFSNSGLGYGEYRLIVETFVSYDGLYYGDFEVTTNVFPLTMLNNQYGLDVQASKPAQITHDVNTGEDQEGNREILYYLDSLASVENPIIRVSLERREYDINSPYGTTYRKVDLANITDEIKFGENVISLTDSCYISTTDGTCVSYTLGPVSKGKNTERYNVYLTLKDGPDASDLANKNDAKWKSGTYRVIFTLYDGDAEVGSVYEYLIIRSLDIDEEIIEGSGN